MIDREAWHAAVCGVTKSQTRLSDWTELMSCELSYRYWNPHQVEKLTTWWQDCSQDISSHDSGKWPQEVGRNRPWKWRSAAVETTKDQTTADQLQDDCQSWLCVSRSLLPLSIKGLSPQLSGAGCQPLYRLPPPPLPHKFQRQNKANFAVQQPGFLIAFWAASSRTRLLVTGADTDCHFKWMHIYF